VRTLRLLTLALLATAAKGQYYMDLCGELTFGPCTVHTDPGAPAGNLLAALNAFYAIGLAEAGPGAPPITLETILSSDAGWLGYFDTPWCCSDSPLFFFPSVADINSWPGPSYVSGADPTTYQIFAMNNEGTYVGNFEGTPAVWTSYGGYLDLEGSVIPDPRLAELGIDPATFNIDDCCSSLTAINDAGDILAQGVSPQGSEFTFELMVEPVPEPSTLPLFGAALAILAVVLHCRSRKKA
jgi:hypothetical protein